MVVPPLEHGLSQTFVQGIQPGPALRTGTVPLGLRALLELPGFSSNIW